MPAWSTRPWPGSPKASRAGTSKPQEYVGHAARVPRQRRVGTAHHTTCNWWAVPTLLTRTRAACSTTRMAADAKTRPDTVLDIDAQRVGALYAKALLSATEAAGQAEAVLAEVDELVTSVVDRQPK